MGLMYHYLPQRLNREVQTWTRLSHPNIAPFYGITRETNGLVGLISPFFQKGNIVDYINSLDKSKTDVLKLVRPIGYPYSPDTIFLPDDRNRVGR